MDLVRCSLTFDNAEKFINGVNFVIDKINKNECGCIKKVLRIKNSIRKVKNWKKIDEYSYCDIKVGKALLSWDNSV